MTILHSYVDPGNPIMAVLFTLILLAFVSIILYAIYDTFDLALLGTVILIVSFMGALFGAYSIGSFLIDGMKTNRLKVKMTEPVDLHAFLERYEIIATEGGIIVLEELPASQLHTEEARHD